jgi:hypothetical protein
MDGSLSPGKGWDFSSVNVVETGSGGPPSQLSNGHRWLSPPGVTRLGPQAKLSATSIKVKSTWINNPRPIRLYYVLLNWLNTGTTLASSSSLYVTIIVRKREIWARRRRHTKHGSRYTLPFWRWKQNVSPNHRYLNRLHGCASWETLMLIVTAVRNLDIKFTLTVKMEAAGLSETLVSVYCSS